MLENRPIMDVPYSIFYNNDASGYRNSVKLRLKMGDDNEVYIYVNDRKWSLEDVPSIIASERASMREELVPLLTVNIIGDKNIRINKLKELELKLYSVNQRLISYSVRTDDLLNLRFERRGIKKLITQDILNLKSNNILLPEIPYEKNIKIKDTIKNLIGKKVLFGNKEILNSEDLESRFTEQNLETTIFEYNYHKGVTFQEYINVLGAHFSAAIKMRKNQQTIFINHEYERDKFYNEEQSKLRVRFPIFILEKFN
ncbi:MAG: hypothetical protein ACI83H_000685 [Glaciecola sp.]|jgi:hypothetical protein